MPAGSIVRIGPEEVSINDVAVHNEVLYCQAPKFMKVVILLQAHLKDGKVILLVYRPFLGGLLL